MHREASRSSRQQQQQNQERPKAQRKSRLVKKPHSGRKHKRDTAKPSSKLACALSTKDRLDDFSLFSTTLSDWQSTVKTNMVTTKQNHKLQTWTPWQFILSPTSWNSQHCASISSNSHLKSILLDFARRNLNDVARLNRIIPPYEKIMASIPDLYKIEPESSDSPSHQSDEFEITSSWIFGNLMPFSLTCPVFLLFAIFIESDCFSLNSVLSLDLSDACQTASLAAAVFTILYYALSILFTACVARVYTRVACAFQTTAKRGFVYFFGVWSKIIYQVRIFLLMSVVSVPMIVVVMPRVLSQWLIEMHNIQNVSGIKWYAQLQRNKYEAHIMTYVNKIVSDLVQEAYKASDEDEGIRALMCYVANCKLLRSESDHSEGLSVTRGSDKIEIIVQKNDDSAEKTKVSDSRYNGCKGIGPREKMVPFHEEYMQYKRVWNEIDTNTFEAHAGNLAYMQYVLLCCWIRLVPHFVVCAIVLHLGVIVSGLIASVIDGNVIGLIWNSTGAVLVCRELCLAFVNMQPYLDSYVTKIGNNLQGQFLDPCVINMDQLVFKGRNGSKMFDTIKDVEYNKKVIYKFFMQNFGMNRKLTQYLAEYRRSMRLRPQELENLINQVCNLDDHITKDICNVILGYNRVEVSKEAIQELFG